MKQQGKNNEAARKQQRSQVKINEAPKKKLTRQQGSNNKAERRK